MGIEARGGEARGGEATYDAFVDVWEAWHGSLPRLEVNRRFYVETCLAHADGPAVELGVGDGRIAVEVARRGRPIVGVDASAAMLAACRRRAEAAGCLERLELVQADFRDFELREPAVLVTIPWHAVGHLETPEARREGLAHVRDRLAPGGRLVFDHFVFDPDLAAARDGVPTLRTRYVDPASGRDALLWATASYDRGRRVIELLATSEELDPDGVVVRTRHRRARLGWVEVDEVRALLAELGYEVEALWGDFDRTPYRPGHDHQVWVARRPG